MGLIRYTKNLFRHDRNTKRLLNEICDELNSLCSIVNAGTIDRRMAELREKTLLSHENGISNHKLCEEEIIVSLTTYGDRVYEVYLAIESIMQGSMKPNRIILWIAEDEFKGKKLPITLQRQQERGLEVRYCKDIRSYKKIIPAMHQFPESCVVTVDDDLMYGFDLLENLVAAHISHPDDICAARMHKIKVDNCNRPLSYLQWDLEIYPSEVSNRHFLTSGGGTLFPPNCFTHEFFDAEKFMDICPYADDVWINAMAWLSGRAIRKSYTHSCRGCDYIQIRLTQDDALCAENMNPDNCRNDAQIKAVFDQYNLYHYLSD